MLEIKGKVNTAVCYAKVIEEGAIEQIRRMCDYELTEGSRVRIMPDVHAGKGCTIGTTMTVTDKACPNIVGVDPFTGDLVNTRTWRQKELSRLDKICERLSAAATNSVLEGKNPVLASEEAISDIFSYIGFKTEHVGGAGDTDVVLKWKDNDDIVGAIVDGKSLSKRFII